jgi:hypothetical protein
MHEARYKYMLNKAEKKILKKDIILAIIAIALFIIVCIAINHGG